MNNLDTYSFWWTEARLLVAALALLLGGVPPIYWLLSQVGLGGLPLVGAGLTIAWIISGAASVYLAYRWYTSGMTVFGGKSTPDLAAFGVAVVSGLNLGIVGLIGTNIGMSLLSNYAVFVLVALVYLWSAYHLYTRFQASGNKLF